MPKKIVTPKAALLTELTYRCVVGDQSIADAAKSLGISRSLAQALLVRARKEGRIQTTVLPGPDDSRELEAEIVREYWSCGVREVFITPSPATDQTGVTADASYRAFIRQCLSSNAATMLGKRRWKDGAHICLGGGRTMMEFAQRFVPEAKNLHVRPLAIAGRWRPAPEPDTSAVVQALVAQLNRAGVGHAPRVASAVVPEMSPKRKSESDEDLFRERPELGAVFGPDAPQPDLTICTMGPILEPSIGSRKFSPYVTRSAEASYYVDHHAELQKRPSLVYELLAPEIYSREEERLQNAGVLGDLCLWGINERGSVVPGFLERFAVSVSPGVLRKWREAGTTTALVLGGSHSINLLRAGLRGGYFSALFIDTPLALRLLPAGKRPRLFERLEVLDSNESREVLEPTIRE